MNVTVASLAIHQPGQVILPTRLRILGALLASKGVMPSYPEMARLAGCNTSRTRFHIVCLERDGLVRREKRKARTCTPLLRFIPADQL